MKRTINDAFSKPGVGDSLARGVQLAHQVESQPPCLGLEPIRWGRIRVDVERLGRHVDAVKLHMVPGERI